MDENEIATQIIGAALKIHTTLGPGLLESVYEELLCYELGKIPEITFERQKPIPVLYEDVKLSIGFQADIIVNQKVIVELKSVIELHDVHFKQVLTYLRLTGCKLGLLINFNEALLRHGIKRVVNGL